jgi:hypothetical protein
VGWRPLPPLRLGPDPRIVVPPLPKHARFCRVPDVRVTTSGIRGVNSAEDYAYFRMHNAAATTCAVHGRAVVTVVSNGGKPLTVEQLPGMFGTYGTRQLGDRTFGLQPGKGATLTMYVDYACDVRSVGAKTTTAVIAVSAGRTFRFRVKTCAPGISVALTPWQPVVPEPPPTSFPKVRATIEGHPHARPGSVLIYRVRLDGPRGYRFPWCPLMTESLAPQNGPTYMLNCRGVTLPATFEIQYALSRHYRPGWRLLRWQLSGETEVPIVRTETTVRID